jgi:hypothetical protein
MSLKSRIARLEKAAKLEKAAAAAAECPACNSRLTWHETYTLPDGSEAGTFPPIPDAPCTCGKGKGKIHVIDIVIPVDSREEAEERGRIIMQEEAERSQRNWG